MPSRNGVGRWADRTDPPRTLVTVLILALLATACGDGRSGDDPAPTGEPSASAQAEPWTFVDDRHVEVSLESTPQRIIAQEDSAAALIDFGIRPVAIFGSASLDENPLFEGIDLTGVESVGEVWAEIDIEKTAALSPDLIVTSFWEDPSWLWGMDGEGKLAKTLLNVAPIVALNSQVHLTTVIGRFGELAGSLGVDLESPELVAERERFETSYEALRSASEANPEVSVLAVGPWSDQYYVASPGGFPDLLDYMAAGVRLMTPDDTDDAYYQYLSYEQVDKYEADVMLYDARSFALTLDELDEFPTWSNLPAVKAGQLVPWEVSSPPSYQRAYTQIEALTAAIDSARDVA